jgi:pilus assembly protein CpaF
MGNIEKLHEEVMSRLDLTKEIGDEELMEMIHQVLQEETSRGYLSLREKASIGRELFNAFRKLDILQEILEDNEVTEIMINGTENIFIEKDGKILQLQKRFTDRRRLEDVIQQMVGKTNRMVNEAMPIVDTRLEDGSRVNIVLHPVALNGPIVTIRKFSENVMTMKELIRRKSISEEVAEFIKTLVVARYNIFVSGGTGSG